MIHNHRKLLPDVQTDHLTKQGIYANFLRQGVSEESKMVFKRPPYYKTVAEVKTTKQEEVEDNE